MNTGRWGKGWMGCQVLRSHPLGEDILPMLASGHSEGTSCGPPRRLEWGLQLSAEGVSYCSPPPAHLATWQQDPGSDCPPPTVGYPSPPGGPWDLV